MTDAQTRPPRIYLSPPHMGCDERALLLDAFDSNWIAPLGPHVDGFEADICDCLGGGHAAALSSGTAALHLALLILGVQRGDEVWCSTFTFVASANAIQYVGAIPVFVDSNAATWNMDPDLLAEGLRAAASRSRLPKAIIVVDLYGQCADYDPILSVCAEYGVSVIEDAAEALGATYRNKKAGTFGEMAIISFNGNKMLTTSGGGMLLSQNEKWVAKARFLATQARDPAPHYQHTHIGYNYRLSNLLAAIGRGQLRVLDQRLDAKRKIRAFYEQALADASGIELMPHADYGSSNNWLTCVTIDPNRFGKTADDMRVHLESLNIEARPLWKPMHLQPVYAGCRVLGGGVSEALFKKGLCLPSGSSMTKDDLDRVAEGVLGLPSGQSR